jgi:hypothetical protein
MDTVVVQVQTLRMPRSPDDRLLTLSQLARETAVSESTLRNWVDVRPDGLSGSDGLYNWAQLREFCVTHRARFPGARAVLAELDAEAHPPAPRSDARKNADARVMDALIRNLRAATASTLDAAITAAKQAEANARSHREQVESLAATVRAYDDLITQLTGPLTGAGISPLD